MKPMTSEHLRRMVISAMFLAIALVVRTLFRMYIPIFGESGMRLSLHVIFSAIPAVLFGPVYGAIVAGLTDFIGFHLSPTGAWLPQITATAFLGGFVRGGLWTLLRERNVSAMRICVAVISALLIMVGVYNMAAFSADGLDSTFHERHYANETGTAGMSAVSRMAVTRTANMSDPAAGLREFMMLSTAAMLGSGLFGLLLLGIEWAAVRFVFKNETKVPVMPLLLAMLAAGVLVSTLNTAVLRTVLPAWQLLPFSVIWLPRVIQTVATTTLMTYFVAVLLGVCERQPQLRRWVFTKNKEA